MRVIIVAFLFLASAKTVNAQKYLFYLHGKIVEDQGANASNNAYGAYEYEHILAAFRNEQFVVMSEVRKPNTNIKVYAYKVRDQIDSLIKLGVKPGNVTVVGASKGAAIAILVSTFLKRPEVNFVFMSSCNDYIFDQYPEISFCGNILSIYEKSDDGNQSCGKFKMKSRTSIPHYKELELNTGLHHGYIYKPLPEWVKPAVKWANGNYD